MKFAQESTADSRTPIRTGADLARALGVSQATLSNWKDPERGVSKEGAIKAQLALGCSVTWLLSGQGESVNWVTNEGGSTVQHGAPPETMAGRPRPTLAPPQITWGAPEVEELPDVFEVELPDNAIAPHAGAGQAVRFDRHAEPKIGDGVLLIDDTGRWHVRIYSEDATDEWAGQPGRDARGFRPLHPAADRVTLVATITKRLSGRISED